MNRPFAILGAVIIFGLIYPFAATGRDDGDLKVALIHSALEVVIVFSMIAYCGFAALHATQRVADPVERSMWLVFIVGLNVAGSLFYYLTKYHAFREIGAGGLMRYPQSQTKSMTKLSGEESSAHNNPLPKP